MNIGDKNRKRDQALDVCGMAEVVQAALERMQSLTVARKACLFKDDSAFCDRLDEALTAVSFMQTRLLEFINFEGNGQFRLVRKDDPTEVDVADLDGKVLGTVRWSSTRDGWTFKRADYYKTAEEAAAALVKKKGAK